MTITIDITAPTFGEHPSASLAPDDATDLWQTIHTEATNLAAAEPLLARRLETRIHRWSRPADLMAATLVARLAGSDFDEDMLHELFSSVLENESLIAATTRDIAAVVGRDPGTPSLLHVVLNQKGFHALQLHRICNALWRQDRHNLALALASDSAFRFGVDIHPAATIGDGVMLDHATGIVIGETAVVGNDVSILQQVTLGGTGKECGDRHPKVSDGVLIGAGATILGNIRIGQFAKVAAGSVVLSPVPAHCTVAGVPAKIVRRLNDATVPGVEMCQSI